MSKERIIDGRLEIDDGGIMYRNFSGAASEYNHEGDRIFNAVITDPDVAQELQDAGWNVKFRSPRDPQDPGVHHIKVKVNFKSKNPPVVFLHSGNSVMQLTEETIGQLDNADIISCDMVISPYHYERNNNSGISAYLQLMHVNIKADPFAHKYANLEG